MGKLLLSIILITIFHIELKAQHANGLFGKKNAVNGTILFSAGPEYGFTDTKESPLNQSLAKKLGCFLWVQTKACSELWV